MPLADKAALAVATFLVRRERPHMSKESAKYLAGVMYPLVHANGKADGVQQMTNAILLDRLRKGYPEAVSAVREYLVRYRPSYEKSREVGVSPVTGLDIAFGCGEAVAHQYVEMFELIGD